MDNALRHNGRIVGKMEGRTFVRRVDPSKHMLRRPPAWAHDDALLDRLTRAGCTGIRIEAVDGSGVWWAPLDVIRSKGFAVGRAGWPAQTALTLENWAGVEVRVATADDVATMLDTIGGAA